MTYLEESSENLDWCYWCQGDPVLRNHFPEKCLDFIPDDWGDVCDFCGHIAGSHLYKHPHGHTVAKSDKCPGFMKYEQGSI